jgi:uncharacterized membrane protein
MLALCVSITGLIGLAIALRLGVTRGASPGGLNAVFRWCAPLLWVAVTWNTIDWSRGADLALSRAGALGLASGLAFAASGFSIIKAVQYGHLGISWTVLRCAMLMPALASLLIWRELPLAPPSVLLAMRLGGLVATTTAVVFLGLDRIRAEESSPKRKGTEGHTKAWLFWVGLAFLSQGLFETAMIPTRSFQDDQFRVFFLLIVFVTGALVAVPLLAVTGARVGRKELIYGALAAGLGILGTGGRVWAVRDLGGLIVFPISTVTVVFAVQLASTTVWKERTGKWGVVGFVLAIAGVLLLSLKF